VIEIQESTGHLVNGGDVLAVRYVDETIARAVACLHGRVLEVGLGLGQTRDALLAAEHVQDLETVESEKEVIEIYAGDLDGVTRADIRDLLPAAVAEGTAAWDSALIDLDPTDVVGDPAFQANLAAALPRMCARVVVITENRETEVAGFRRGSVEPTADGRYVLLFDRFDPAAGVGEASPHGSHYHPGYGWIPKEEPS